MRVKHSLVLPCGNEDGNVLRKVRFDRCCNKWFWCVMFLKLYKQKSLWYNQSKW